jgi:multidrug efflux pump subunit AcrA (membrane-fusion protein)
MRDVLSPLWIACKLPVAKKGDIPLFSIIVRSATSHGVTQKRGMSPFFWVLVLVGGSGMTSCSGPAVAFELQAGRAEPVLEGCLVSLIEEVKVPAREAGVIVELAIREGAAVTEGEVLARIDDDQPQMEKRRAQAEHDQTLAKAESDVDVRYSQKAKGVAEMTFKKAEDSHLRIPGSVTEVERERLKLEWEKTGLQIEQAELERRLAALDATSKGVEVEAAEKAIERRVIRSPITGEVEEVFPHQGEWLQPGDPLARVIRTDRLKVEGFVDATRFNPADVRDRPVAVEARLAGGRSELFQGRIVNVRPRMESGSYRVVAEVDNRQEDGEWLLRTGQFVTMTVHSGQPPLPPAERKRSTE